MKETKYYCDKCNKEIGIAGTQDEKSIDVNLTICFPEKEYSDYSKKVYSTFTLCNDCAEKHGVKRAKKLLKDTNNSKSDFDNLRQKMIEIFELLNINIEF